MNNESTPETFSDPDDYPEITQAEIDRAVFRVNGLPAARKRRVTIFLDEEVINHYRAIAGDRGYQTLINQALRQAVERDDLEERLRRVIREEMTRYSTGSPAD